MRGKLKVKLCGNDRLRGLYRLVNNDQFRGNGNKNRFKVNEGNRTQNKRNQGKKSTNMGRF